MNSTSNIYIKTASRKTFDLDGLLDMIQSVLSDNDTAGNNGPDYISDKGIRYCKSLKLDESEWSDDIYFRHVVSTKAKKDNLSEEKIFKLYKSLYSQGGACDDENADVSFNENKQITSIAYAWY